VSVTKVPDEELLVFDHEIAADPKRVFTAYLDPSQLHPRYGPAGWRAQTDDLVVESVVGGIQRVRMVNDFDPGATCVLQSRFLAIEPYHELEYAEQPCASVTDLAVLRRRIDVPIAADESIGALIFLLAASLQLTREIVRTHTLIKLIVFFTMFLGE